MIIRSAARALLICLALFACSPELANPSITEGTDPSNPTTTAATPPPARDCVRFTSSSADIATGDAATDALYLSGEIFVCADEVVIAPSSDLNVLAAAAQLAAAVRGPLLLPHPQLAAEVGRLKPRVVHIVGTHDFTPPPGAMLAQHDITGAVDAARQALGVSNEIRLPATPDASTIIETVSAIAAGDRVVLPQTSPTQSTSATPPAIPSADLVAGLAQPVESGSVWLVEGTDPVALLTAAATAHVVDARVMAFDSSDILGFPEVGTALSGIDPTAIRFVGSMPDSGAWELAVLLNGHQLPGGGFSILGDDQPKRYVAFYGHPSTSALGVLGEQGPQATLDRMAPFLIDYQADGYQTIATFEMMASVASADASDGDYSSESSIDTLQPWIDVATEQDAYVILDLQPGRDDFLTQAKQFEQLLLLPNVGLALDPEWRLGLNQVHLQQVGRVEASEVNLVVDWLADLVRDNGLPQKMLIVHQFREFMIQERSTLKQRPELQMVLQMDGQGPIGTKDQTWAVLTSGTEENHWKWGWKNFFDEDSPTPSPEHTMGKEPVPVFVSYQ